jgi:hypothetical protein
MAIRRSACAALALIAAAWAMSPASAASPRPALEFQGARLGMSLKDWQAVPVPLGAGPDAIPVCTDREPSLHITSYPLSAREVRTGVVLCSYKARFGHDVLTHSIDVDRNFSAQSVAYVFRRGRLDQIRFVASTDAYGDIRRLFGLRPLSGGAAIGGRGVGRTRTWRVAGGAVKIGPGPNPSELTVDLIRRRR